MVRPAMCMFLTCIGMANSNLEYLTNICHLSQQEHLVNTGPRAVVTEILQVTSSKISKSQLYLKKQTDFKLEKKKILPFFQKIDIFKLVTT